MFEAALSGLALISSSSIRQRRKPFIDPQLFADNNFRVGVSLIFVVGVILLASVALLTPLSADDDELSRTDRRFVLGPRGVGTMAAMMLVGRVINRVDRAHLPDDRARLTAIGRSTR